MNKMISVVIPVCNEEKGIGKFLDTRLFPELKKLEKYKFEIILVNDGSKDNTWQKILEMKEACEKRFKRVIFQTKENEGTCKTLNLLIDLAKGKFIYIIASDDIAKPNAIKKELSFQ